MWKCEPGVWRGTVGKARGSYTAPERTVVVIVGLFSLLRVRSSWLAGAPYWTVLVIRIHLLMKARLCLCSLFPYVPLRLRKVPPFFCQHLREIGLTLRGTYISNAVGPK